MDRNLGLWRHNRLRKWKIDYLYYFALVDNLETILIHGIRPKNWVNLRRLPTKSFANEMVQQRRDKKTVHLSGGGKANLHDLVPVYLCPLTPTLYAVKGQQNNILHMSISHEVLEDLSINYSFTDGNAACHETSFHGSLKELDCIPWDVVRSEYWNDQPDGKRKRNAEFLIQPYIDVKWISKIYVNNTGLKEKVAQILSKHNKKIPCDVDMRYFFP